MEERPYFALSKRAGADVALRCHRTRKSLGWRLPLHQASGGREDACAQAARAMQFAGPRLWVAALVVAWSCTAPGCDATVAPVVAGLDAGDAHLTMDIAAHPPGDTPQGGTADVVAITDVGWSDGDTALPPDGALADDAGAGGADAGGGCVAVPPDVTWQVRIRRGDPWTRFEITDIAATPDGGVGIAGTFHGAILVGDSPVLTADPIRPTLFVARVGPTGLVTWASSIVGVDASPYSRPHLAALADGALVVAGRSLGDVSFGASPPRWSGGQALFAVRLEPDGAPSWVVRLDGKGPKSAATDVLAHADGSLTVAGFSTEPQSLLSTGAPLPVSGSHRAFLARIAPDGKALFVADVGLHFDTGYPDNGHLDLLAAAPDGGAWVGGRLGGTGGGAWTLRRVSAAGATTQSVPLGLHGELTGLAATPDGGVLITATFDEVTLPGRPTMESRERWFDDYGVKGTDVLMARFGAGGEVLWDRQIGTYDDDVVFGVEPKPDGGGVAVIGSAADLTLAPDRTLSGGWGVVRLAGDGNIGWLLTGEGHRVHAALDTACDGAIVAALTHEDALTLPPLVDDDALFGAVVVRLPRPLTP